MANGKCTQWNITHLLKDNIMNISGKWTELGSELEPEWGNPDRNEKYFVHFLTHRC